MNKKLCHIINQYNFTQVSDQLDYKKNQEICNNLKESAIIIINSYSEQNEKSKKLYFFIGFKKTILLINQSSLSFLQNLFSENQNIPICFLSDSKSIFNQEIKYQNNEIFYCENFKEEIRNFNQELTLIGKSSYLAKIWCAIRSCISGYLIKQSYLKLSANRSENFTSNKIIPIITKYDYIILRQLGLGSISIVNLIYHFEKEEIYALKMENINDDEITKLKKREYENYCNINHPYLPKFYGKVTNTDFLVTEFIDGQTLFNLNLNFDFNNKLTIIFTLMTALHYLHKNKYVYRDLKPGNIMINKNNEAVLIDFDRMVKFDSSQIESQNNTNCFTSYAAHEVNSGKFFYESDVYSLGMIIFYLMANTTEFDKNSDLYRIYKKCIKEEPNERPSILKLLVEFYLIYHSRIKIKNYFDLFRNDYDIDLINDLKKLNQVKDISEALFIVGCIFYDGKYVERDFNKAILYFSEAAELNNSDAQYRLGMIYYKGDYIQFDIEKAIHFLSKAANQNNSNAQYILGYIYYHCDYARLDINKFMKYFTLAAEQNHPKALLMLSEFYLYGKYVKMDIKKSIYYLELAANQNDINAQFNLGVIYEGNYIKADIKKAIHYYTLAADKGDYKAQFNLGLLYIKIDINKSLYYLDLSSKQNFSDSNFNLGILYMNGEFVKKDLNKAIYYFTLAANQNHSKSQFNLGYIYFYGIEVPKDINRGIYFYTLSSDQNEMVAQEELGSIFSSKEYGKYDLNKSFHYYNLAAKQNSAEALYNIGKFYQEGKLFKQDLEKAIDYYTLSADKQFVSAQLALFLLYFSESSIFYNIDKAIYYLICAANNGNSNSQYQLGLFYLAGKFVDKNINKSLLYLSRSAINGNIDAIFALGYLYHEGKYVERNIFKAIYYYKEASSFNHLKAKNNLGVIYRHGFDNKIQKDLSKAMEYFNEIIKHEKDSLAMFNLASLLLYEKPFENSINKSIELFKEAYKLGFDCLYMLMMAVSKKNEFDKKKIFNDFDQNETELFVKVCDTLNYTNFAIYPSAFDFMFNFQQSEIYLYDCFEEYRRNFDPDAEELRDEALSKRFQKNKISSDFYDGFGIP